MEQCFTTNSTSLPLTANSEGSFTYHYAIWPYICLFTIIIVVWGFIYLLNFFVLRCQTKKQRHSCLSLNTTQGNHIIGTVLNTYETSTKRLSQNV
ncbi:unnamed protein product [Rotaria sp. Silwood1]|nr:unnamed protein product [Rotaria sp. Silwood1]CAF3340011.1 unnamed protein product [Rotaria sp. Silwood1]CAF3350079.1 unnamed protein product [Rotaria sp. Silwood1]CAF3363755.1 unnamed protein product [Rotaria sp. Silwood1]CAF4600812.1 unnamed protein product [Rotaria sp. Silwood1]